MNSHPERTEHIQVILKCLDVDEDVINKTREIFKPNPPLTTKDTLTLTFHFYIFYYNIIKQLKQIEELLDTGKVKMVSTAEFNYSKSLIQDMFCKFEKIEKRLRKNRACAPGREAGHLL